MNPLVLGAFWSKYMRMLNVAAVILLVLAIAISYSLVQAATVGDGSVDSTVEINSSTTNGPTLNDLDLYGISIANIGDLNGDGVNDIAVGAISDAEGGSLRGAIHIHFMNIDGSVDSTVEINSSTTNGPTLNDFDLYGISIANIGDLNGDGVNDIAVGATGDDEGGDARGAVHISFMNTDGSVDSTVEINSSTTNGPTLTNSDNYGRSIANIGDLNGDGVNDIAVGATGDDEGGDGRGAVHISFLSDTGNPVVSALFPADGATNVTTTTNLILTFDEAVDVQSGNIIIYNAADDSIAETIDVTSGKVTGSGTTAITINPTLDLTNGTTYYVQIDATAFDDSSSNSYAGISDKTTFNFTTEDAALIGSPILAPLPSTGGGVNDFSISMNQTRLIGTLSPMGSNLLMYIWSKAEFLTRESGTNINQKHSVFLEHLDLLTNKITLAFTPDTVKETLSLGETTNVDLNNDAIDDINVTFSDLQYNRVEVTLVDLYTDTKDSTEIGDKEAPDDSFNRDLYVGVSGEDVLTLQKFLNTNGFTLTDEGLGSQGNETTFYGHLTRDALIQFQTTHDIFPTWGYFGPLTRDLIAKEY